MKPQEYLNLVHILEKLKDTPRHSYTSDGRRESVAEHTYRLALMAFFIKDEFPSLNIDKLIRMCLIHDLGEIFTGDIPSFEKTQRDEEEETKALMCFVESLPLHYSDEMSDLYKEMAEQKSEEAKVYKALDNLEAVIQHNEADLSTWSENEYELNLVYGEEKCRFSDYLTSFRLLLKEETINKIQNEKRYQSD